MKNIESIMAELGIEIPEEKKDEFKRLMAENYRTVEDYNKQTKKRDEYKDSLDKVQGELDGFKDVDVDKLKSQIATLTEQLTTEKNERAAEAKKASLEKLVSDFLASTDENGDKKYEFLNDITAGYYKTELTKALDDDSAKGKSISDIFAGMITDKDGKQKSGIFVDKAQNEANKNKAMFSSTKHGGNKPNGKPSMAQLMKMKNENPDLDISQYIKNGND